MEKHPKIIKSNAKRNKNLNPKEKIKIKEYGLYNDWKKFVKNRIKEYGLYNDWKKFVKNRIKKPKQNGS